MKGKQLTADPIISLAASERCIVLIRSSGEICVYSLSSCNLELKFKLFPGKTASSLRVQKCALNNTSSRLLIIDGSGILKIVNVEIRIKNSGVDQFEDAQRLIEFERKDVWDIKWFVQLFHVGPKTVTNCLLFWRRQE